MSDDTAGAERSGTKPSWLWRTLQVVARLGTTLMFDLKVYGTEHVPSRGGVLILANHQSYLDPVLLGVKLNRPVSYMAKSELFEGGGFFKWLISSLHAFPVKQGKGDVGAIKQAINRLHEGYALNVYPEGTRSQDGEIGPIQPGVVLIVKRADVPIVPVVIDGSFQAWPRSRKLFCSHPIRVMFGPPINIEGLSSQQILAMIEKTLRDMLKKLRAKEQR